MKKKTMGALGLVLCMLSTSQLYSQSTNANNSAGLPGYLGWATGTNSALEIRNDDNQPIGLYTGTGVLERMLIGSNGQVFIGNPTMANNVINGPLFAGTYLRSSLLNVRGPINSCGNNPGNLTLQPTILYGYTTAEGSVTTAGDGFRMHMNVNFPNGTTDGLVFERTDGDDTVVDGLIAFTNTSRLNNELVSLYINGQGRTCFGRNLLPLGNRVVIDSDFGTISPVLPPGHVADATPSGLRFVDLPSTSSTVLNPGTGVLSVDANGNVIYVNGAGAGGTGTPGGAGGTSLGNYCGTFPQNLLGGDYEIPLNDHNYYYTGTNSLIGVNHVGVGYSCTALPGKFSVKQVHPANISSSTIAISGINEDIANVASLTYTGVEGKAIGVQTADKVVNRGGYFTAINSSDTRGVVIEIPASTQNTSMAIGGEFLVTATASQNTGVLASSTGPGSNTVNRGVFGEARDASDFNIGGEFIATSTDPNATNCGVSGSAGTSDVINVGGSFSVTTDNTAANMAVAAVAGVTATTTYPASVAIGLYSNAAVSNNGLVGYAAFFDGNAWINGPATTTGYALTTSDRRFKTDIQPITKASEVLGKIDPKTYFFDTTNAYGLNFSNRKQYGLIAQEVEKIMPELVHNQTKPAMINAEGKIVTPSIDYKAMNYDAFISILIKGHQEQQEEMTELAGGLQNQYAEIQEENKELKNQLDALNAKFAKLEACLQNMLPGLCDVNQGAIQQNSPEQQLSVNLSDKNTIVLNQNVPNPFAESTVITYSIPVTVKKAQIHFYDAAGKLLQSVEISERGAGRLQVFGSDLSSGTYTYSLIADGEVVATKKLVKE